MRLGLAATISLSALSTSAFASSPCIPRSIQESLESSSIVVLGEILAVSPADAEGKPTSAEQAVQGRYQVRVLEEFKGTKQHEYGLLSNIPKPKLPEGLVYAEDDGFVPEAGKRYLLFAWGSLQRVNGCASLPYPQAKSALKILRKGTKAGASGK